MDIAGADGLRVTGALVTHYHPDHVGGSMMGWEIEGVAELLALDGVDAPIHVQPRGGVRRQAGHRRVGLGSRAPRRRRHRRRSAASAITLLHTPGHTPGSQCFLVDGRLVAGDTLFLDGCGRTDLPGGDSDELYYSLTQRLATVPDDTVLYPGHLYSPEPSATMGETRATQLRVPPPHHRAVAHHVRQLTGTCHARDERCRPASRPAIVMP